VCGEVFVGVGVGGCGGVWGLCVFVGVCVCLVQKNTDVCASDFESPGDYFFCPGKTYNWAFARERK
jgi:hypothetical protein